MVSRDPGDSAGSPSSGSARASSTGWIQVLSGRPAGNKVSAGDDGPRSIGRARRCGPWSMSRHTFVAMRYSHDRSDDRPSKLSMLRHARTIVSCTASSASKPEPSMR